MEKGKLMKVQAAEAIALSPEVKAALGQMGEIMRSMADMLRATNERMASLEREVRLMTKVTPAQANAINEAIRQRAVELCGEYRAKGCEKAAANAIRRIRVWTVGTRRWLPGCASAYCKTGSCWIFTFRACPAFR